jgi:hypothetical protein
VLIAREPRGSQGGKYPSEMVGSCCARCQQRPPRSLRDNRAAATLPRRDSGELSSEDEEEFHTPPTSEDEGGGNDYGVAAARRRVWSECDLAAVGCPAQHWAALRAFATGAWYPLRAPLPLLPLPPPRAQGAQGMTHADVGCRNGETPAAAHPRPHRHEPGDLAQVSSGSRLPGVARITNVRAARGACSCSPSCLRAVGCSLPAQLPHGRCTRAGMESADAADSGHAHADGCAAGSRAAAFSHY